MLQAGVSALPPAGHPRHGPGLGFVTVLVHHCPTRRGAVALCPGQKSQLFPPNE